jgi:hypothetical protein
MIVPNLPKEKLLTASGHMHPVWQKMFSQLLTALNQNNSNEGTVLPAQGGDNFNTLNNSNNTQRLIYNSDQNAAMINNTGTYSQIATAAGAGGVTTQTTVGASGAASPTPAAPEMYESVNINGVQYARPLYKVS